MGRGRDCVKDITILILIDVVLRIIIVVVIVFCCGVTAFCHAVSMIFICYVKMEKMTL